jgi:isopenicillin N synthase-like dioxygenase
MATGEWKYIRYYKNHIVLSLGDSMEFLTGGILKAAPHRVKEPPEDQRQRDRFGLFYFVPFLGDVPLSPINHPALERQGAKDIFKEFYDHGGKPLLSDEWLVERSKLIGTKRPTDEKDGARKALYDIAYRYSQT